MKFGRGEKLEIKFGLPLSIIEIHVDLYYFDRFVAYVEIDIFKVEERLLLYVSKYFQSNLIPNT